jgi:hypothetical protein
MSQPAQVWKQSMLGIHPERWTMLTDRDMSCNLPFVTALQHRWPPKPCYYPE